ncbi:MAG: trypsin-like serine protease [Bdellovibrio sp.]|nr:trypsin-like serine protease [Bdellovibrio sp.]
MNLNFAKKTIMVSLTAIAGSVLLFSCAKNVDTSSTSNSALAGNIIGGQAADATFEKTNGVVGLVILSKKPGVDLQGKPNMSEAICTGSLIGKRTVLTAAHCLMDPGLTQVIAIFNLNIDDASAQKTFIRGARATPNENFSPSGQGGSFVEGQPWNDIAIVQLSSDAPADFQLTQLPTEQDLQVLKAGSDILLAGYGVTTPIVNQEKTVKGKKVITPVADVSNTAGILRFVTTKVLVATKDNKEIEIDQFGGTLGACHGDSGGPAFIKNAAGTFSIIGVTSRGTDMNGNCDKQNVYTNVYGQLDWIKANM